MNYPDYSLKAYKNVYCSGDKCKWFFEANWFFIRLLS